MVTCSVQEAAHVKERDIAARFRNSTAAEVEQFVSAGHKVWKGTVGAGEGLWIPPGFLFTEYTSDKEGVVGMKMFGAAATNLTLMRQLYKKLESTASKAPLLFIQLLSDVGELVKKKGAAKRSSSTAAVNPTGFLGQVCSAGWGVVRRATSSSRRRSC